jgi:hypothetical protein
MNSLRPKKWEHEEQEPEVAQAFRGAVMAAGARGVVVNRTHRVVREQALHLREQRQKSRSLWVPLGIFSFLMPAICYAIWSVLDGYEPNQLGIPTASGQMMVLLLWSLPVTAVVLGMVWIKRGRGRASSDREAQP